MIRPFRFPPLVVVLLAAGLMALAAPAAPAGDDAPASAPPDAPAAPADDASPDADAAAPTMPTPAEFNAMIAAMNPVLPQHRRLAVLVGTWHQTFELMMAPGAPPFVYECISEQRLVVGDQWVRCDVRPATADGFAFSGLYVYGFDTTTQRYTAFGIDSLGSYPVTMEGDFEPDSDVLALEGTLTMPGVGTFPYVFRIDMTDPDRVLFSTTVTGPAGGEVTNMRMTAVRVAEPSGS